MGDSRCNSLWLLMASVISSLKSYLSPQFPTVLFGTGGLFISFTQTGKITRTSPGISYLVKNGFLGALEKLKGPGHPVFREN